MCLAVGCQSFYSFIYPSICLSICLSIYLHICLSVCLSIFLSVYEFACLLVCLSLCLFIQLSFCLFIYLCLRKIGTAYVALREPVAIKSMVFQSYQIIRMMLLKVMSLKLNKPQLSSFLYLIL